MRSKKIIAIIALCIITLSSICVGNGYQLYTTKKELKITQSELSVVQENYKIEAEKSVGLSEKLGVVNQELNKANNVIADFKNEEYKLVYLGEHKLTHYCNEKYKHICGNGDGLTAIGTQTTVGKTAAVDPKKIPYGSQIYIEGYGWRVAEDCGSDVKGSQIDILVDTHSEAYAMGVKSGGVWMLVEKP